MGRLVLLDRDGTINVERHYLSAPEEVELLPGAAAGLAMLGHMGLHRVVVTNQSAIGRGRFDLATLERIHDRLRELLILEGADVDAIYVCPHHPDDGCRCRKPAPGLVEQAARDFQADATQAFVIGDKPCDIELGQTVGAKTILVRTGYGLAAAQEKSCQPDYVVNDLLDAARLIRDLAATSLIPSEMKQP